VFSREQGHTSERRCYDDEAIWLNLLAGAQIAEGRHDITDMIGLE
jgi:hypothetical protein